MPRSIKLKNDTYWDISSIHLDTKNYSNNITSIKSGLAFNGNSQQLIRNNTNLVVVNLTFKVNSAVSLNTNQAICVFPSSVMPRGNVVLYARTYNSGASTHGICYLRPLDGTLQVNFGRTVNSGEEISIVGAYYMNI